MCSFVAKDNYYHSMDEKASAMAWEEHRITKKDE